MNLPNKLTMLRILLVPFLVLTMLIDFPMHYLVAGLIFGAASLTDLFDGKIAREQKLVTDFGKFADPLADKILVMSVFICFISLGHCSAVPVIIMLFREFAVTSIRLVAASQGKVVAANMWGKIKTVAQIIVIIILFLFEVIFDILAFFNEPSSTAMLVCRNIFDITGTIAIWIATLFTVVSGIKYIIDNREFISQK